MPDALVDYGIAGAVVAAVFVGVIAPLLKHLLTINRQALELLRRAVETNTKAVETFQRFEDSEHAIHERLVETQEKILELLMRLDAKLTNNHKVR